MSVRDLVAFKHLGMPPANTNLTSINGNPANTAVDNLTYRPRTGRQAEAQAEKAKKAEERAEKLAEKAEIAAQKAREAAEKAALAGRAGPTIGQAHRCSETGCLSHPRTEGRCQGSAPSLWKGES